MEGTVKSGSRRQIDVVVNPKGGVAKTTTVREMGVGLSKRGKSILLIDLDPTAVLSQTMGADIVHLAGIGHALNDENLAIGDVTQTVQYEGCSIDICAGGSLLTSVRNTLATQPDGAFRLKELLEDCPDAYDHVVIDTPGDLSSLTINALVAATQAIVPVLPEEESKVTLPGAIDGIRRVQKHINPTLDIAGILICRYTTGGKNPLKYEAIIQAYASKIGEKVFETRIRQSQAEDPRKNLKSLGYKSFVDEYLQEEALS